MAGHRQITQLARELRKCQTPAEKILWNHLRNRKLFGVKFFRQHPIIYEEDRGRLHFFIPDFYSAEQKLIIELDGKIHDYQKYYDRQRDIVISQFGLTVLRFRNEEVHHIEKLKAKIVSHFHWLTPCPALCSPPFGGTTKRGNS